MGKKSVRIEDPKDFDEQLAEILAGAPGRVFAVIFGTEEASTGQSWCPDCVVSDPKIRRSVFSVPEAILIEAPVGPRAVWRDRNHPYRKHALLSATSVPTLYEFNKDGTLKGKLVEGEAADDTLLSKFVS
ncbi:hypothetical protein DFJ73DRAFT_657200 [Zopfochytrium polystomum]|nr:hypothetical protein DFJ73DRAFT_657200 [Zopfochytrium polystomum]